MKGLAKQLQFEGQFPHSCDLEVNAPQTGRWEVCEALLNLKRSEVLLCRQGNEFAVIEHFQEDSPYAQAKGRAEILMQGNDGRQLADEFRANARHTLAFMASNATAQAQKIVWEQYPENKPGDIMAAISERCHQAVTNEETISEARKIGQNTSRGIRI